MPFSEGVFYVELPVVDELLGFDWEDDAEAKMRSKREMERHIVIYGNHHNPIVHATFKQRDGQIPCMEIDKCGGGRTTWRFQQEAEADDSDAQFIWNAVTGRGRNWAVVAHREESLHLLYLSGDRECITIRERDRARHMRFTRVHPGGAQSALLPALERAVEIVLRKQ